MTTKIKLWPFVFCTIQHLLNCLNFHVKQKCHLTFVLQPMSRQEEITPCLVIFILLLVVSCQTKPTNKKPCVKECIYVCPCTPQDREGGEGMTFICKQLQVRDLAWG